MSQQKISRDKTSSSRLFILRNVFAIVILGIFSWFENYAGHSGDRFLIKLLFSWLLLNLIQLALFQITQLKRNHLFSQLLSDIILIGLIIYGSGGVVSPFIFLFGLVIITAGSQARVLLTLIITVLATTAYIVSIYSFSSSHDLTIQTHDTLKILLQTSLFFLTGGIMALIARGHAALQAKQKQTSTEYQKLQDVHSHVLNAMHEGIIILNPDYSVQAFNPAASNFLGLKHQHAGFNISSFLDIPKELLSNPSVNGKNIIQHELSIHNHDLLLTFTKLDDNKRTSWLMTIVDITQTRILERQLAEHDKLASMGQMAAMLAHEIRNPMQTISQAAELMGLEQKNDKLEHIITDEISRLNRLVSDMLDYANPLHPKPVNTDIKALLNLAIQQVDLNNNHSIQLSTTNSTTIIDPDHFRLVLDNLLRNALRVSPKKESISIAYTHLESSWQLCVRDHGHGIDENMKKTLFDPFKTGHKKGVGLGLATVWQVCQVNNWGIEIDESVDEGACFIVSGKLFQSSKVEDNHG